MMRCNDRFGRKIRLSEERWQQVLDHSEMENQEDKVKETLKNPEILKKSKYDDRLLNGEGFIITAFFTDKIKKGEVVWKS